MARILLSIAASSGFLSVLMGAFGAHLLKHRLEPQAMDAFETAVKYQMSHTLLLLIVALFVVRFPDEQLFRWSAYALIVGITLFSGSLYGLSIAGYKLLGPLTPLGGLALLLGWVFVGVGVWRSF